MANALRASWGVTDSVYGVSGVVVGIDLRSEVLDVRPDVEYLA